MKAFLMYRDRDFALDGPMPPNAETLTQDLELDRLFAAMAAGDKFLRDVAQKALLASLHEPDAILYRQHVLADCLEQPGIVREVYAIAVEAIEREKRVWSFGNDSATLLHRSVQVLEIFVGLFKRLRRIADEHGAAFRSEGLTRFFKMISEELDDEYLRAVEDHLQRLKFRDGALVSAELGEGNKGTRYVLRQPRDTRRNWKKVLFGDDASYVYQVADRDQAGFRALAELRDRGVSLAARALAQSTDHILSFFSMLRAELAFYAGCLNLRESLARKDEPICFPEPLPADERVLASRGLYDICLSLSIEPSVVGNDVGDGHQSLVMITGANRGGKSTFLRSLGLAQLMMQSGMFVAAESFRTNMCDRIFTHFRREEDASMRSGKLDEELQRMDFIVDHLTPNSLVLLNESFAATNEREGSEIARQIVRALLESNIKVCYVTHMFDLAHGFHLESGDTALFLRAERTPDGRRTYRVVEGEPLPTSHGEDLYRRVFGTAPGTITTECGNG